MKRSHRTASLLLLCVLIITFDGSNRAQTRKGRPSAPSKTREANKPITSPCGVTYRNLDDLFDEIKTDYWYEITSSASASYLYHPHKVFCDGSVLKVWIRVVNKDTDQRLDHSMIRYGFKCRSNQMQTLSYTEYDKKGDVIYSSVPINPQWVDVIPDSVGEDMLKTACRK